MCRRKIELEAGFGKRDSPLWQTAFYRLKWIHRLARKVQQEFLDWKHGLLRCQTRQATVLAVNRLCIDTFGIDSREPWISREGNF